MLMFCQNLCFLGQIIPMSVIENLPLYSDKEIVGYRVAMKNETTAK